MNDIYKILVRPLFFRMNAENAHNVACSLLSWIEKFPVLRKAIESLINAPKDPITAFGVKFPNSIGLAAGFDKDGQFPGVCSALGFGHMEVGTVTPKPQPGNPTPRLFRLVNEESIINRMGFNNHGAEAMCRRIARTYPKGQRNSPLGVNIGKAKVTPLSETLDDYLFSLETLAEIADYFTINISSPNTPGLREFHKKEFLEPLLRGINQKNISLAKSNDRTEVPCLLKVSPDESFSSLEKILEIATDNNVKGLVATNTTVGREKGIVHPEEGGLSGKAIEDKSLQVIKFLHRQSNGKMPIIGVGGISDVNSAARKMDAGAILVQLYTGFVYEGPFLPKNILKGIRKRDSWTT